MKFPQLSLFIALLLAAPDYFGQSCGTCSLTISNLNNTSYTVGLGETLCIDSLGQYTGTLTLNGGTVCNKGVFRPNAFNYNSGTINNYARIILNNSLTLDSSNKIVLCEKKSFLKLNGILTLSGGSFTNKGITNVQTNINHTSGTLSNSGIINCKVFSGNSSSITNTGIINKD